MALSRIKNSLDNRQLDFKPLKLGNLYSKRDWGYAKDYVYGMWLMLQQDEPDDYVLATNETHSIKEFVNLSAEFLGIELEWIGDGENEKAWSNGVVIVDDERYYRPAEVDVLLGDYTKAKTKLGWEPEVKFKELVEIMTSSDSKPYNKIKEKK
jgi:GDPmannose 4,6-dehydratase